MPELSATPRAVGAADCVFCPIVAGTAPSWRVHETEHAVLARLAGAR
ncbi:MAG: hypothetical protein ACRDN0_14775 [Trebonia sp.]